MLLFTTTHQHQEMPCVNQNFELLFECNQNSQVYNATLLVLKVDKKHLNKTSYMVIDDDSLHVEKNEDLIPLLSSVLW